MYKRQVFIREQQLDKSGHGFTHSNFIAFIEFSIQMEIFIEHMRKIHAPHSPGVFGQTVGDQTVFFRQQFRTHLGNFPARQIVMNSVENGAVIVKFRWTRAEKDVYKRQLRTSVDHGTAFDKAGQNLANEASMMEAIQLAAQMAPYYQKKE